jgi:serine/threonine-protein kinase
MEPATTAPEARRFGKYTLVAKLATGGMAEIFLARLHGDGGFEKLVCIKRILPHLANDPQFVAMFLDEARVAARISHPNVCQVFELGECEGQYYIAMEYLEGVPLSLFRRKDFYPQLPDPRLVAGFGVQACEGLHHAHQLKRPDGELLGVVHRDISPQNLFATTDGIVKVLDFGIAKVQDASARTSTGAVKGTYAYMAPEQLRNEKLDRRVDVWAMGAVLWETLAQQQLFKRDTEFLTFEAITKEPIPDIREVRPDVPPLLGDVIARALSRHPEDRFASARALGEALGQAVAPLGGAAPAAAISDDVSRSFEATLAEQRMLLRIVREGGQFDLETSSPLVAHGTKLTATPVSNIQRRVAAAKAEVAHFVAASAAIESLYEDEGMQSRPHRFGTDGAFTPAPARRVPSPQPAFDEDESGIVVGRQPPARASSQQPAQRAQTPYPIAPSEWRQDDTETTIDEGNGTPRGSRAHTAPRSSKLPWIVATIAIAAAAAAGAVLYMELKAMKSPAPAQAKAEETAPVVMKAAPHNGEPAPAAGDAAAQVAVVDKAEAKDDNAEPNVDKAEPPVDKVDPKVEKVEPKLEKAAPDVDKVEPNVEKAPPKLEKLEPKLEKRVEPKKTEPKKVEPKVEKTEPKKVEPKKIETNAEKTEPKKVEETRKPDPEKLVEKPAEKAVAQAPGSITIDSTPVYAVIYIDGKKYGETPLVNVKLAAGKHSVRAVSPSGSTKTATITIEAGKTAPVKRIEW